MARHFHSVDHNDRLRVTKRKDGKREVFLKLTKEQIERARASDRFEPGHEVQILTVDHDQDHLVMHPTMLLDTSRTNFLDARYDQIGTVVLEGFGKTGIIEPDHVAEKLEALPPGFVKDYEISLGLAYDYRFIVEQIEELTDARTLIVSRNRASEYDAETKTFTLAYREFEEARKAINRITNRARDASSDVKEITIHNALAPIVAKQEKQIRVRRNPMTKRFQEVLQGEGELDDEDHGALVDMVTKDAHRIARSQPEKLALLRDEVQLATLDSLIDKFERMLGKSLSEDEWQTFFTEHPFILSFVFGYPVIQVEGHASVGGKKISGGGEKIADFLYQHELTGNTALFEIKTPRTPVLASREYRGGLYGPHQELSGAISQVLDQRYQFQLHFATKVVTSERLDLKSYAIACCVIAGTLPTETATQKSFELFRRNSRDVQIVTFDELLEKLKQLKAFLTQAGEPEAKS